ncbi:glycoside hydrolase family 16 protein [Pseudonocardia sp. TRM90224]|uniref:glycoside hydrolase family 16 protein n=1 Tax=Pseudonocardia sp. TRM90224 TaxID=2812678 RepID=UPI001E3AEF5A|nr:glycoside hydrolase family 16 protein [Pseudonocardia sp. TRM90224]
MTAPDTFDEHFTDPQLDPAVWTTSYLPAWSSRAAAAATYTVEPDGLHLSIPPEQPLWCPDLHEGRLRVSAVQSGNWSGPLGSTRGQQPFREGLTVREVQPTVLGWTPHFGRVEVECSARIGPRSMFSAWMVGIEDVPTRCGEICLVEVFGDAVGADGAAVGSGIHPFRDPVLTEEFSADQLTIDVSMPHRYTVDWRPGRVEFFVDGVATRVCYQAPDYPMQLILGVFDFPDHRSAVAGVAPTPELVVHRVRGSGHSSG